MPTTTLLLLLQIFRCLKPLKTLLLRTLRRLSPTSKMDQEQPIYSDDPPFDPSKPSTPVSFPIRDLQTLESRSYLNSFHYPFNIASVPLPSYAYSPPSRPRTLVCHDMAGGYQDDKWVQGGSNPDAYAIWHWYLIDVFVYFSHTLVTLPPPCWTNAAHAHGVKVLGTFITEWDEGRAICNTLFSTKESAQMYAELLTELASLLGFDGWLMNMEVQLDLKQIPNLKVFISHLTQTMHSSVPGSLVIWYDSVTKDGNLGWQNQLNEYNKPFFDLCDGIFVNYSWQEDYPKRSAAVAGERKFDVYMGIDVWGRSTYGGGQWNTNVALDVLKKDDVSAAIFAPGWVYETKQPPDFQSAQNRWWGLVEKSWGILQNYPKVLPFYSNFDQGHGYHFSVEGSQVADGPWNNISCQSFQPVLDNAINSTDPAIQVFINFQEETFSGGGSITFKGSLDNNATFKTRLFQGELPLEDLPIHISYSVRSDGNSLLGLSLGFSSNTNGRASSILVASGGRPFLPASNFHEVITPLQVKVADERAADPQWTLHEASIKMSGYTLTEIYILCYMEQQPHFREPALELEPPRKLGYGHTTIGGLSTFYASLGDISIRTSAQNMDFPPAASWSVEGQDISWSSDPKGTTKTVSVRILWKLKAGDTSAFIKYNIYVGNLSKKVGDYTGSVGGEKYIGVARAETFYVSDFEVPAGVTGLNFIIQVCGLDGACQKLNESPAFQLAVKV